MSSWRDLFVMGVQVLFGLFFGQIPSPYTRQKDSAILMLHAAQDAHDTVTQSKSESS